MPRPGLVPLRCQALRAPNGLTSMPHLDHGQFFEPPLLQAILSFKREALLKAADVPPLCACCQHHFIRMMPKSSHAVLVFHCLVTIFTESVSWILFRILWHAARRPAKEVSEDADSAIVRFIGDLRPPKACSPTEVTESGILRPLSETQEAPDCRCWPQNQATRGFSTNWSRRRISNAARRTWYSQRLSCDPVSARQHVFAHHVGRKADRTKLCKDGRAIRQLLLGKQKLHHGRLVHSSS